MKGALASCIGTQRTAFLTPRENDFVIEAIELHVLQAPSFVDASRNVLLSPARKIWGMKHGYLDPFSMVGAQSCQKGST